MVQPISEVDVGINPEDNATRAAANENKDVGTSTDTVPVKITYDGSTYHVYTMDGKTEVTNAKVSFPNGFFSKVQNGYGLLQIDTGVVSMVYNTIEDKDVESLKFFDSTDTVDSTESVKSSLTSNKDSVKQRIATKLSELKKLNDDGSVEAVGMKQSDGVTIQISDGVPKVENNGNNFKVGETSIGGYSNSVYWNGVTPEKFSIGDRTFNSLNEMFSSNVLTPMKTFTRKPEQFIILFAQVMGLYLALQAFRSKDE